MNRYLRYLIRVKDHGFFRFIDSIGDGNCFFRAICEHEKFSNYDHYTLRQDFVHRVKRCFSNWGWVF